MNLFSEYLDRLHFCTLVLEILVRIVQKETVIAGNAFISFRVSRGASKDQGVYLLVVSGLRCRQPKEVDGDESRHKA
jgi:hypothetical protein